MRPHTIRARAAAIGTLALALAAISAGGATAAPLSSAHLAPAQAAVAAPRVTLSRAIGPPTTTVAVSGTGFRAHERVDVYFGTADLALARTSRTGQFGPVSITVPASATPGTHWVSAQGRHSGRFAQARFTVSTDWAQFRFSATHKGVNPYENVLSPATVPRIGENWRFTTGSFVESSPAVANGVVYIASYDGNVYALNASTGAERWSVTITSRGFSPLLSSPAVANGVVYIGSYDGNVYALNASTGAKLWSFNTTQPVESSPAVANGVVYIGSDNNDVYALNASTGAKLWSFTTGSPLDLSSPAVANGVVYIGSYDGNMYALNASTGAKLWSVTTGTVDSSPAVANGVVYIGARGGNMYALNASTGAKLWSFPCNVYVSSPAVANGVVYVGSFDSNLYAFGLPGGLAASARPGPGNLHPDYGLREQR